MEHIKHRILLVSVLLAGLTASGKSVAGLDHIRRHCVSWETPSAASYDGMPLGNGSMGMLVSVAEDGVLHLLPSHTDAWSEAHRLLKLGKIEVVFSPNPFEAGFRQTLMIDQGLLTLEGPMDSAPNLRVDANHPVFLLEAVSGRDIAMQAELHVWRHEDEPATRQVREGNMGDMPGGLLESGDVVLKDKPGAAAWYHRNQPNHHREEAFKLHQIEHLLASTSDLLENRTFGGWLTADRATSDSPQKLTVGPAREHRLRLHTLNRQTPSAQAWIDEIEQAAAAAPDALARQAHLRWWADFWQTSWIDVSGDEGADVAARGYAHVMYMNALAGRGDMPLQWNGSIFSPDPGQFSTRFHGGKAGLNADPDWRNWGNLLLHQNTRLPYYSMPAAGQAAFTRPYIDMYTRGLPLMRAHTQSVFGHAGTFFREGMSLWGLSSPGCYGFTRKGLKPGQQANVWHRTHWQGGLEIAYFMAEYFAYTQDERFARETLVPFTVEIVRFFDLHWTHREGKLRFPHVFAMETFRDTDNPMPLVAGLRAVIRRMLDLPEHLVPAEDRTYLASLLERVPDIPMRQFEGKTILANAEVVRGRKVNAEVSELYAVFPYHLYGVGLPDLKIAQDTWYHRTVVVDDVGGANPGWARGHLRGGWRQESVMAAMTGLTDIAREEVSWAFGRTVPGMRYPGFFGTTYDWVPDVQHGGMAATALQRMLLQEVGDQLILLPAWPENWNVGFKLHARKKTIIEGRVENGRLTALKVTPECRLKDVVVGLDLQSWNGNRSRELGGRP